MTAFPLGGAALKIAAAGAGVPVAGAKALPCYLLTAGTLNGRAVAASPARPVKILSASDLGHNGGHYELVGNPQGVPVIMASPGEVVEAGPAIPVYFITNGWPNYTPVPPPTGGVSLLTEDGKTMLTETGLTMIAEG